MIKIYCDLDGVLVAFDKGYQELTGLCVEKRNNLSKQEFWDPITKAGHLWWANLEWMEDGYELWNYIKHYKPTILSAPSREESSKIGKKQWLNKHLPNVEFILKPAHEKCLYASPTSLLIDDNEINIYQWIDKGGVGILFTNTQQCIKELKEYGL